jgi:hypothetical protein
VPRHINALSIAIVVIIAISFHTSGGARAGVTRQSDADRTHAVLAKTRAALGGDSRLQTVRGLSMSGRFERVHVGGTLAGTFRQYSLELSFTLPDIYLRQETTPMDSGTVTYVSGFRHNVLLNEVRTSGADMKFGGSWGPEQIDLERAEFARLVLAYLTLQTGPLPLQFLYKGVAAGPDGGNASVLEVTGPKDFAAKLYIDNRTGRPVMLSYLAMVHLPPLGGPASGQAKGNAVMNGPSRPEMRDVELRLSDYKAVNGVYFPQRIIKSAAGVTLERTVITKIAVNPAGVGNVLR